MRNKLKATSLYTMFIFLIFGVSCGVAVNEPLLDKNNESEDPSEQTNKESIQTEEGDENLSCLSDCELELSDEEKIINSTEKEAPDPVDATDSEKKSTLPNDSKEAEAEIEVEPPTQDVEITITGIRKTSGELCILVFKDASSFPDKEANAIGSECYAVTSAPQMTVTMTLNEAAPLIAITVFHDENGDGTLNTSGGALNLPLEPYGFSNNPGLTFGPPKFDEVKIENSGQENEVIPTIELIVL